MQTEMPITIKELVKALHDSQPAPQQSWLADNSKVSAAVATMFMALLIYVYQNDRSDQRGTNEQTNEKISDLADIVKDLSSSVQTVQQTQAGRTSVITAFEAHKAESALHNQQQDNRIEQLERIVGAAPASFTGADWRFRPRIQVARNE